MSGGDANVFSPGHRHAGHVITVEQPDHHVEQLHPMQLNVRAFSDARAHQRMGRPFVTVPDARAREIPRGVMSTAALDDLDLCRILAREAFQRGLPVSGPFRMTEWQARGSVNRLPKIQRRNRF